MLSFTAQPLELEVFRATEGTFTLLDVEHEHGRNEGEEHRLCRGRCLHS